MTHPDLLGWAAAALMVGTFACRDARCMRPLAVATNLAFLGYGLAAALPPIWALHLLLLPINLWRWAESLRAPTSAGETHARTPDLEPHGGHVCQPRRAGDPRRLRRWRW
ncbi:MAG: hypothetical protein AB7U92_09935 [Piscinibacter sp.]|uniref:hypothetical protein n=1 Tax=Piscinibacter sp. TaxID=1903157 RepID=UPI003D10A2C6